MAGVLRLVFRAGPEFRALACAALLVSALGGCPGDDDSADDTGDGGQRPAGEARLDVCEAHIDWVERCSGEPDFGYTTEWGQSECPLFPWRHVEAAYIDAAATCFETLPCTSNDDDCTGAGLQALGIEDESDLASDELVQRCVDKADACAELGDDNCLAFVLFTREGRAAAAHCLDEPCADVEACLYDP